MSIETAIVAEPGTLKVKINYPDIGNLTYNFKLIITVGRQGR
jgi:hypothetical protein